MKDFVVNFFYSIHITAKNDEEAEKLAINDFENMPPSLQDFAIEVEKKEGEKI